MINIIGQVAGSSGYDCHTKELARALNKITDVRLTTQLANWDVEDFIVDLVKKKPEEDEINLIITNPTYWRVNCTAKRNFVYLIWEGDKLPKFVLQECLNPEIEKIIVPSKHTKQALINSLASANFTEGSIDLLLVNKIILAPHGVSEIFKPKEVKNSFFTFIANKGFRNLEDRGGIQYLLKAYLEEFSNKDKVELLIKINPAYGIPNIHELITKITDKKDNLPRLKIETSLMKYENLPSFYNKGDVFVSPTRAEAFNLGGAEAKASGLMTIQTDFGGQTDYMVKGTDIFLEYELTEVKHELQYEGVNWATPKIEDLKKQLRWCYDNQEEVKERGKRAVEEIKEFTWDKTANSVWLGVN